jgi:hypothetical protein
MATVLDLTDTHCPFMHADAIPFLNAVANDYPPDVIVHGGDVADFHFSSFYAKSSKNSGDEELDLAAAQLNSLSRLFRDVRVCYGNHDERLFKKLESSGLPKRVLRTMNGILGLPDGWKWADSWDIDGVVYEHGSQYGGQDAHIKAARNNLCSTVIGHVHAHAGVHYVANRRNLTFGMNAGCLIDPTAYAFEYARKQARPVVGCGLVVDGIPTFLPMMLDSKYRWIGRSKKR